MFTKIQIEIMKEFVSKITTKFSIKQISEILGKKYAVIHRSIIPLIENNYLVRDEKDLISLNYRINNIELSYVESLRKRKLLDKNKDLKMFCDDCFKSLGTDFFISLLFGSSVVGTGRDIDLLFMFPKSEVEKNEKIIRNIANNFTLNLDITVISVESAYEMLSKYETINVLNELLNKHIILFGGENFYRILNNARQ
jgi:hypothetical protein